MHYQLIIIGSGPAGLSAAIYGARALLKHAVIEGQEPGGQLTTTTDVENYPGFPDFIQGPVLMQQMRAQAQKLGTEFVTGWVTAVDLQSPVKKLTLSDGRTMTADTIIIATGASAKWLGIESEQRLRGRGVTACATCDGFFFKGKEVAVVGGGDTALQEAVFMTRFSPRVHLLHRRDSFTASKANIKLVEQTAAVTVHMNTEVAEVLGEQAVSGVRLRDTQTGAERELPLQGLFIAIGHKPNTDFLEGSGLTLEKGYIKATDHVYTQIPGVFVAGDCEDHVYRQAITSAGFGCMALLAAEKYLTERQS